MNSYLEKLFFTAVAFGAFAYVISTVKMSPLAREATSFREFRVPPGIIPPTVDEQCQRNPPITEREYNRRANADWLPYLNEREQEIVLDPPTRDAQRLLVPQLIEEARERRYGTRAPTQKPESYERRRARAQANGDFYAEGGGP